MLFPERADKIQLPFKLNFKPFIQEICILMYYVLHSTYFKPYLCYVIKSKQLKQNKMKTIISNKSGAALEIANNVMYSFKVLLIGLFIPFMFAFGISYKMPKAKTESGVSISQPNLNQQQNTVDLGKAMAEKNS